MTAQSYKAPETVGLLQQRALIVGGIALVLGIVGWAKNPGVFVQTYLNSYLLILGLTLGSLGLLMLQHLTGGHWGIVIRRPLEAATRTLPLLLILFVPIALGMNDLYGEWLHPEHHEEPLSELQQSYLTHNWFLVRAAIYFAVWITLMLIFNAWSRKQDVDQTSRSLRRRFKLLAGPGIILYVFAMSFAAIDWVMSITPHWGSTIYGFIFVAGQLISSMSLMICVLAMLSRTEPFASILTKRHLHDVGKLLFAFILLWAYFDFSQLLIIWSGNQPHEITFYMSRLHGPWGFFAVIVLLFHFFIPFFILLSSDVKRSTRLLPKVAMWMIFMRGVELFWLTRPEFSPKGSIAYSWLDLVLPIALVGIWLAYFAFNLKQQPLLPLGDPKLAEAIGNHEH